MLLRRRGQLVGNQGCFAGNVYLKCPDVCPGMTIVQLHILWSMMLLCMIVKLVELVDRIEMRKTDCFGKTRLVPHVPSSS